MDYSALLGNYSASADKLQVEEWAAMARKAAPRNYTPAVYKACFGALDLTSLNEFDSVESIGAFVRKTARLGSEFPGIPPVATVCVYPPFVGVAAIEVEETDIGVTSVAAGFPAAQTFLEVKMLEIAMAVEEGADEVDVVMNVGEVLAGDYDRAANDVEMMREEAGEDTLFKVIIEAGSLSSPELVYKAALLAMHAGADFVKSSTGKTADRATPEAAVAICAAIRDFHAKTGRKVGFKVAGGVRKAEDAALYYTIVEQMLGETWLTPALFRIGASSLADSLLSAIEGREVKYF